MANWLDKYEQGGMVLKQKTKDNYGKKPNPNNVKVSTGPNYVGSGYDIQGRDYSPAWSGQFQNGGNLGEWFGEEMYKDIDYPPYTKVSNEYLDAMSGMMKSKMASQAALGNPAAKRLFSQTVTPYQWTGNEPGADVPEGNTGTHFMGSHGNYAIPGLQEKNGKLEYIKNPSYTDREAMYFDRPEDAEYFGEHYKEVAPLMRDYGKFQMGGSIPGAVGFSYARTQSPAPSNGPYAKKTKASAQNGGWLDQYDVAQEGEKLFTGKSKKDKHAIDIINNIHKRNTEIKYDKDKKAFILPEVKFKGKPKEKGFWEQSRDAYLKEHQDDGLLGALGSVFTYPAGIPKQAMMYGLTGKVQEPTEAMGIRKGNEGVGGNALNFFSDPVLYTGEIAKAPEAIKAAGKYLESEGVLGSLYAQQRLIPRTNWSNLGPKQNVLSQFSNSTELSSDLMPYISRTGEPRIGEYIPHQEDDYIKWFNEQKAKSNPTIIKGDKRSELRGSSIIDINDMKEGGVIKDDRGQWAHPGEITEIGSNDITMEGVPYDVLGISDTGDTKLMKPGKNYKFKGKKVTEFPMAKNGLRQEQKGLVNLDQLTNFTNYNKKQPGGWLDQY